MSNIHRANECSRCYAQKFAELAGLHSAAQHFLLSDVAGPAGAVRAMFLRDRHPRMVDHGMG